MFIVKRVALLLLMAFIAVVFGTFALNYYRAWKAGNEPPAIIFERDGRPSRA